MNKRKMAEAGLEAQINPKELARKMRGEQTIADIAAPSDDEEDGDFEPVPKRVRKQTDRFVDSKYCQHNIPKRRRTDNKHRSAVAASATAAYGSNAASGSSAASGEGSDTEDELYRARKAIESCRFDPEPPDLNAIAGLDDVKANLRAQLILPWSERPTLGVADRG